MWIKKRTVKGREPSPLSLFQAASRPLVSWPNISALTTRPRLSPLLPLVTLLEFTQPHTSLCPKKKKKKTKDKWSQGKQVPETDIMRIELCFVCFWLTENKFLEESEVVELVVEPVQSLLLGGFLAWFWPQVSEENEWEWEAAENWREEATVENCTASIARVWISSFLHCLRVFVFVFYFYPLKSTEISLW